MFYRKFNHLFQDVILVGCGGTGSRVISPLIQTIKQAQAAINPCLYVVDGDIFEHKNLARQNCIEKDIGRNKAVVMAERYGAAHNFPVVAYPHMIEGLDSFQYNLSEAAQDQGQVRPRNTPKLWILCVDSINARLAILRHVGVNDVVIDAGNEDTFGQVSIFDRVSLPHARMNDVRDWEKLDPMAGEYEIPFIPAPLNQYLHALANPPAATGSCADLDQSLAINNLMAAGIINVVQNLAYNNKFYFRTNYYDLIQGNNTERMTYRWFNEVWAETTEYSNSAIETMSSAFVYNKSDDGTPYSLHGSLLKDIREKVPSVNPAILAAIRGKN